MSQAQRLEQIREISGGMTSIETAQAAGQLMNEAGVDRETVQAFYKELDEGDRGEMVGHINDVSGDDDDDLGEETGDSKEANPESSTSSGASATDATNVG